jgi:hypothetical protein
MVEQRSIFRAMNVRQEQVVENTDVRARGSPTDFEYELQHWRTLAAAELKRLHGIDDNRIPERIWKQFYVQNSTAREAANRAQHIGPHFSSE